MFAKGEWLVDEEYLQKLLTESDDENQDDDLDDPDYLIPESLQEALVEEVEIENEHAIDEVDGATLVSFEFVFKLNSFIKTDPIITNNY